MPIHNTSDPEQSTELPKSISKRWVHCTHGWEGLGQLQSPKVSCSGALLASQCRIVRERELMEEPCGHHLNADSASWTKVLLLQAWEGARDLSIHHESESQ